MDLDGLYSDVLESHWNVASWPAIDQCTTADQVLASWKVFYYFNNAKPLFAFLTAVDFSPHSALTAGFDALVSSGV